MGTSGRSVGLALAVALAGCVLRQGQQYDSFSIPRPLPAQECLVLGFLGGWERWDKEKSWVRKTALALRARGVAAETIENSRKWLTLELAAKGFDTSADGSLSREEIKSARLILYGLSFGGAAVTKVARRLNEQGVPVLLTIQVDSVGRNDALIPPNVQKAANLYQRNGWFIKGEPEIRAERPESTRILGNWRFDYRNKKVDLSHLSWHKRLFATSHIKMSNDPDVWAKVEELILAELARVGCLDGSA